MEEKKVDKYQEPVEDEAVIPEKELPAGSQLSEEAKQEVPSAEARVESVQKPELSKQVEKVELPKEAEPSREAEPKKEAIEAAKPTSPADDKSSAVSTKDDKALYAKKVEEIKKLSQKEQIKALCNLAFEKDIDFATETAKGLNDAYVLDEFHDKLDKLDLIKKGKLKEI
ncbi:MAG: hypothetical protein U9P63_00015 [Patescibacteria group bacterium]|nr:hypothetical protein [Patescibacteria group bacterium]